MPSKYKALGLVLSSRGGGDKITNISRDSKQVVEVNQELLSWAWGDSSVSEVLEFYPQNPQREASIAACVSVIPPLGTERQQYPWALMARWLHPPDEFQASEKPCFQKQGSPGIVVHAFSPSS